MIGKKTDPRLLTVRYNDQVGPLGENCVIVDLDGTLALMNGRSPFDGGSCGTDKVNNAVKYVIGELSSTCLIYIFSGRNSDKGGREATIAWLRDNNIGYDYLVMREEGDTRSDTIVKKEMFRKHIDNKFNVVAVFDDRPSVIRLWDSLGLDVFDVHPTSGEF